MVTEKLNAHEVYIAYNTGSLVMSRLRQGMLIRNTTLNGRV